MVNLGLFLAALQAVPPAAPPVPNCSLVTPRGDDIRFFIWSAEGDENIRFSPLASSVWPTSTVVGVRRSTERVLRFDIGSRDGFVFELNRPGLGEARRTATLFLRSGQRATLPVAYGYCQDAPVTIDPSDPGDQNEVGADDPAFDVNLWPDDDCGLLLGDGRRARLTYRLPSSDRVRLQSADLWSGRPVTTSIRWARGREARDVEVGLFSEPGGFGGTQMTIIDGGRAAKLIRLFHLRGPLRPDVSAYGICGHRRFEPRPGRR